MAESALRREKRRERAAYWAALTPVQRLRRAARLDRAARLLRGGKSSLARDKAAEEAPFRQLGEVLALLRKLRIPHALIGGWAVVVTGAFRTSDDLDLLADFTPSGRKRLLEALAESYEAEWRGPGQDDPIAGLIRARPRGEGMPLDILAARGGADRDALARARVEDRRGLAIPVPRREDLIAMKLEAGGGQDYVDARVLLELPAALDEALLLAACRERRVLDRLALIRRR